MEPIPFTIPVAHERSIIFEEYTGAHFYPHLHRHKEYQLMWIIDGRGTLIADHNIYRFKSGDMYLLGANQPHVFKTDTEYFAGENKRPIRGLGLFFNPNELLAPLFSLPEMGATSAFLRESLGGFKIPEKEKNNISKKLLVIQDSKGADQLSKFLSLIHDLFNMRSQLEPLSTKKNTNPYPEEKVQRIQVIYDYILKNYENNITLEEVADRAHFTPPAFCRYFKKHTGKTFVSFLNELRVNEACKKLIAEKEEAQISNIAYECGFNSVTNFNRVFKTVIGSSPSVYQRQFLTEIGA